MVKKKERVAIFIDGRNFYHSTKRLERKGFEINLGRLVSDLVGSRELITVYYYNALLDKEYDLKRYEEHNKYLDGLSLTRTLLRFTEKSHAFLSLYDEV